MTAPTPHDHAERVQGDVTAVVEAKEVDPALVDRAWNAVARAKAIHGPMSTHDVLRHALAAVLPDIQAQALRDAADEMERYAKDTYWRDDSPFHLSEKSSATRHAERLRERATRLTATTEEPTDV